VLDSHGQEITALKMAVKHKRHNVVEALIRRFPGVNFDVISLKSSLAEPVALVLPSDDSRESVALRDLVATGEFVVNKYFNKLKSLLQDKLSSVFPPELVSIVQSFSSRMPLSTRELVLLNN